MSRSRNSAIVAAIAVSSVLVPAHAGARMVSVKFNNCAAMVKRYPGGIAASKAKKKNTSAFVSSAQYKQNKILDIDGNGIACDPGDMGDDGWSPYVMSGTESVEKTLKVPNGKVATIAFTFGGEEVFNVTALDKDGGTLDELVSTVGEYSGTVFLDRGTQDDPEIAKSIDLLAEGPWTARVAPASASPEFVSSKSGTGDMVFSYEGKSASVTLEFDPDEVTASIWSYTSKGYLVESPEGEDGLITDEFTVTVPKGGYIAVRANGPWRISKD